MSNPGLARLVLLRFGRLSRRKWLIFLGTCLIASLTGFLILDSVLLIVNQFTNLYHWIDCLSGKMLARQEVCLAFERERTVGNLCSDWCGSGSSSVIQSCPSSRSFHAGKECIFHGVFRGTQIIVKAKKLKAVNMVDEDLKLTRDELIQGLQSIVSSAFEGSMDVDPSFLTIPWTGQPTDLSVLTDKELYSLWILVQDNEFILSTFFGQKTHWNPVKLMPQLVGTCGHFYAVEYIPEIVQLSDIVPSDRHQFTSSFLRRLHLTSMLLKFLLDLESNGYNLHLCDVKYDQFGIINGTMVLIDSDMLYSVEIVSESINQIDSCIKDEDCDFVDCKGRCKSTNAGGTCSMDTERDNNLKRFCRNLLFIEDPFTDQKETQSQSNQITMGLLSSYPSQVDSEVNQIYSMCSQWIAQPDLIPTISKMIDLAAVLQSRLHH